MQKPIQSLYWLSFRVLLLLSTLSLYNLFIGLIAFSSVFLVYSC